MGNNGIQGIHNDLVSICLITYNQEEYIKEALEGIISQTYENLEIIISDDNSSDATFDIIKSFVELHKKSFKFKINRNETNLGIAANVNRAIEMSSGQYIVLAAGDDISLPERVSLSVESIHKSNTYSVTFNANIIDSNSIKTGTLFGNEITDKFYSLNDYFRNRIVSSGSTRIIDRKLLEIFGNINNDCPTEDSVFNFRSILSGGLAFRNVTLVNYRIHGNNISDKKNLMLNIDPVKIFNQYKHDLEIAYTKGYVNYYNYTKLLNHLIHYRDWEINIRILYNCSSPINRIKTLVPLLFSSIFNFKEKIVLTKFSLFKG